MPFKLTTPTRPPAITTFLTEWRETLSTESPFGRERLYGLCGIEVEEFAGTVWLKSIRTLQQPRHGHATRAVEALCALADRHQVPIILHPKPFGPTTNAMSVRQLRQWYSRFGFKLMRNGSMRRYPTQQKGDSSANGKTV